MCIYIYIYIHTHTLRVANASILRLLVFVCFCFNSISSRFTTVAGTDARGGVIVTSLQYLRRLSLTIASSADAIPGGDAASSAVLSLVTMANTIVGEFFIGRLSLTTNIGSGHVSYHSLSEIGSSTRLALLERPLGYIVHV